MRRLLTLISLLLAVTFITACGENCEQTTTVDFGDTSDTLKDDLPLGAGPYPIADLSISFDDAAGNLTFAIELGDATPQFRADLDRRYVAKRDRNAAARGT